MRALRQFDRRPRDSFVTSSVEFVPSRCQRHRQVIRRSATEATSLQGLHFVSCDKARYGRQTVLFLSKG